MIEASRGRGGREDPLLSGRRTQGAEACWKKNLNSLGQGPPITAAAALGPAVCLAQGRHLVSPCLELVMDREAWCDSWARKELDKTERLN